LIASIATSRKAIDPSGLIAKGTEARGHAALVKALKNRSHPWSMVLKNRRQAGQSFWKPTTVRISH
jgi:hypothetical protein